MGYAISTAIAIITTTFGNGKLQRVKKVFLGQVMERNLKEEYIPVPILVVDCPLTTTLVE